MSGNIRLLRITSKAQILMLGLFGCLLMLLTGEQNSIVLPAFSFLQFVIEVSIILQIDLLVLLSQYFRADFLILSFLLGYFILSISRFTGQKNTVAYSYWGQQKLNRSFRVCECVPMILSSKASTCIS